jgi:GR25 family glycosyltransferase involved in LPS biosynthesis
MEDDVVFRNDFSAYWKDLLREVKSKPWDILYGYCWDNKNQFSPPEYMHLYRTLFNPCCHFWAIRDTAYDYIIDKIEENDKSDTPTVLDNIFTDDKKLMMYCPNYNLVGQRVNESDTESRWQDIAIPQYNGVYWHG